MNDLSKEIWKSVIGYEGLYEVSNLGRIKSLPKKQQRNTIILRPVKYSKYNHLIVCLVNDKIRKMHTIHKLVLNAFIGPRPSGMECRHLDSNARNNTLENLKWGTPKENCLDRIKLNRQYVFDVKNSIGSKNIKAKLNEWQVRIIKRLLENKKLIYKEISEIFNISICTIRDIDKKRTWIYL